MQETGRKSKGHGPAAASILSASHIFELGVIWV